MMRSIVVLVLAGTTIGCGGGASSAPRRVRISILPYLTFAPLLVAEEEGYFREQGLEIESVQLAHSDDVDSALAAGQIDVGAPLTGAGLFNLIDRGARVRIVADKGHADDAGCNPEAIMARSSLVASGRLSDPRGLAGLRVSIATGNIEQFLITRVLARGGLTLGDVEVSHPPVAAEDLALKDGRLDLAYTSEPQNTRLQLAGTAVAWMPVGRIVPHMQTALLAFGTRLLDRDPAVGERFMAAYLKAVRRLADGKTDRNVAVLAARTKLPVEVVRAACWPSIHPDGHIEVGPLLEFQRWAVGAHLQDHIIPPQRFWDGRFVAAAKRILDRTP